ncbi:unnamed protein product [Caenorhabditis brenneri]
MGVFRYILIHTSVCQLVLLTIEYFCQFRMISHIVPVELRCYGPLRSIGSLILYALHQAYQFWLFMSGMSIIVTLYFKLMTFSHKGISKTKMLVMFFVFHIPVMISAALEIYLVITVALPKDVQDHYIKLNSGISDYSIIGTLKLQTVSFINFLIMVGSVFAYPVASGIIRWRILKHLGRHSSSVSSAIRIQHRSFVKGLTIQSVLPFLTYFPMFCLYVICVYTGTEIVMQQYFIYIMPTLPAFFDPFVTLYFVVPYRKALKRWIGLEKNIQVAPSSVTNAKALY